MARLYANENFPYQVVIALRALGHDVLTVQEAGNAGLCWISLAARPNLRSTTNCAV